MNHNHTASCKDILHNLNEYIDGELDPLLCSQLEAHIDTCNDCQIVVNTLQKTIQLCQSDGKLIQLPQEVRQRLLVSLGLAENEDE